MRARDRKRPHACAGRAEALWVRGTGSGPERWDPVRSWDGGQARIPVPLAVRVLHGIPRGREPPQRRWTLTGHAGSRSTSPLSSARSPATGPPPGVCPCRPEEVRRTATVPTPPERLGPHHRRGAGNSWSPDPRPSTSGSRHRAGRPYPAADHPHPHPRHWVPTVAIRGRLGHDHHRARAPVHHPPGRPAGGFPPRRCSDPACLLGRITRHSLRILPRPRAQGDRRLHRRGHRTD